MTFYAIHKVWGSNPLQLLYDVFSVIAIIICAFSGSFKKRNSIFFVNMIFQMPFLDTKEFKESNNQLSPLGGSTDYLSLLKTEGSRAILGLRRIQHITVIFLTQSLTASSVLSYQSERGMPSRLFLCAFVSDP